MRESYKAPVVPSTGVIEMQFTYANRLMGECLQRLQDRWSDENASLAGDTLRFAHLLTAGIVRHRGCYILRRSQDEWGVDPEGAFTPDGVIPDRSGYEDFANHLRVSEFVRPEVPDIGVLGVGVALAEALSLKLRTGFPGVRFRIMVSFRGRPLGPDDRDFMRDCRVSFHALRQGEAVIGDLESFHYEAIGIIEV